MVIEYSGPFYPRDAIEIFEASLRTVPPSRLKKTGWPERRFSYESGNLGGISFFNLNMTLQPLTRRSWWGEQPPLIMAMIMATVDLLEACFDTYDHPGRRFPLLRLQVRSGIQRRIRGSRSVRFGFLVIVMRRGWRVLIVEISLTPISPRFDDVGSVKMRGLHNGLILNTRCSFLNRLVTMVLLYLSVIRAGLASYDDLIPLNV